ncbi:MAG: 50S ribosomal protein L9 [Christensenellales bacterium]|jgi:large subunit ribosomal protein L9
MKVILQQDIKGTGKSGDVINVSEGYARNFLLPKGLALPADSANMAVYNQKKGAEAHRKQQEKEAAQQLAEKLAGQNVVIEAKTGEKGRLFGSISSKEIADTLAQQGFSVDKRKIVLKEPIRSLGKTDVDIKLYAGISTKISVEVKEQS